MKPRFLSITASREDNSLGRSVAGFTLIEMIGALAIIAICASLIIPVVVRRIDRTFQERDATELSGMSAALQAAIARTGQIPDATTIVGLLANEMGASPTQIAANSRSVARAFLVDPNLWIGSPTGRLPYNQSQRPFGTGTNTAGGMAIPGQNLRLLILSSLTAPLPNSINFDDAWTNRDGGVPSTWAWSGKGEDLRIQRVDFTPLFRRVILNPVDENYYGSFAIESGANVSSINVVTQVLANSWYLQGTALRLYDTNSVTLETKTVIQQDASFVFENLAWRGELSGWGTNGPNPNVVVSPSKTAADFFTMLATNVVYSPLNPGARNVNKPESTSPWALVFHFYAFMNDYNLWAQGGFGSIPPALNSDKNMMPNVAQDLAQ